MSATTRPDRRRDSSNRADAAARSHPGAPAHSERFLRFALGLLLLLCLAGALLPGSLLWGVNHQAYLPLWLTALWAGLAALALWPRVQRRLNAWLGASLPRFLFESRAGVWVVPLATAVLFWIARSRSFFMGDGHLLGELTTRGVAFHGFDDMDYALRALAYRLLGSPGLEAAFRIYQWFSVAAGALGIVLARALLRRFSWEPWRKACALILLFGIGPASLYFGYVEAYAFLFVFLTAFMLSGLLVLQGRLPVWIASVFFGLAVLSHLTAVFSAPALLYLLIRAPGLSRSRKLVEAILPPAVPAALWILIHLVMGWDQGWLRRGFIENEHARMILLPLTGEQGVLTLRHWKNLGNLALITAPVPLAIVLAHVRRLARGRIGAEAGFLLAQVIGIAILGVWVDRKLGTARDWDLLAAHSSGLVLLAMTIWARTYGEQTAICASDATRGSSESSPAGPVQPPPGGPAQPPPAAAFALCVSLLVTAPWVILQHMDTRSAVRLAGVAGDFPDFAKPYTYEELGMHFRLKGDFENAREMYRLCVESGPENPRFRINLGTVYAMLGRFDLAQREYEVAQGQFERALRSDPGNTTTKRRLAQILVWRGEPARAVDLYAELVQAEPKDRSLWEALGSAALDAGRPEVSAQAFRRALEMGSHPSILDESEARLREVLGAHPDSAGARALLQNLRALRRGGAQPSP